MTMLEEAKKYGPPRGDIAVDEEMLELVIAWVHGEVGLHAAAKASGKMKTSFQGMAAGIIRRAAAQGRIKIILLTLVLLLTQISIAQETPHPFWDASQQRGLAVNAVLRGADASVTCFNLSRRNGRERSAPVSSCGGIVAWDAAMVGGEIACCIGPDITS